MYLVDTIEATTGADIRRHRREDDQEENDLAGYAQVIPPQLLRKRLGVMQEEFAQALRIPLSSLRSWEQGRVPLRDRSWPSWLGIPRPHSGRSQRGPHRPA